MLVARESDRHNDNPSLACARLASSSRTSLSFLLLFDVITSEVQDKCTDRPPFPFGSFTDACCFLLAATNEELLAIVILVVGRGGLQRS